MLEVTKSSLVTIAPATDGVKSSSSAATQPSMSKGSALTTEEETAMRRLRVALEARFIALVLCDHNPTRTRLLARLARSLPADEYRVLQVRVPQAATRSRITSLIMSSIVLTESAGSINLCSRLSAYDLFRRFEADVAKSYRDGQRTLVIFDDAHLLPPAGMHLVHALSNITAGYDLAVPLILAATTSFAVRWRRPAWRALASRTGAVVRVGVER
ncbi:MAG: ATP-binding protein [Pyrinomonadaceae bacterium MAG19_C2-C3]|nr:ATP-binding protein [Pyrinomonadaceae bacterium MAG19_C2-C3]